MQNSWLMLLPFMALATGWLWDRTRQSKVNDKQFKKLSREYFVGLNYLLNEQPDKAVDVFIKLLDVDDDTVETHLALGNVFRRRGEVDRAIRVHQNLIAQTQLTKQMRIEALLALGQDYMRAGVLDRAERLFLDVVETGQHSVTGLKNLLDIYQQEKDWDKALATAQQIKALSADDMSIEMAHYYCEQAIQAKSKGQFELARRLLRRALKIDKRCVRASIIQGDIKMSLGQYTAALRAYKKVRMQDPVYIALVVPSMAFCHEQLDTASELVTYLHDCLREFAYTDLAILLAEQIQKCESKQDAADFMAEQLRRRSSIRGLDKLIELHLGAAQSYAREDLLILKSLTTKLLENKALYRCVECGFDGKALHWQCASCKKWSTVKPLHDVDGESLS